MRRTHANDMQTHQNVIQMRRPHENDVQKRQKVSIMRRPHEKDIQNCQNVKFCENLNRCSRCHFRNLQGRFSPVGFIKAELAPNT